MRAVICYSGDGWKSRGLEVWYETMLVMNYTVFDSDWGVTQRNDEHDVAT
jgi:hypothetical protein